MAHLIEVSAIFSAAGHPPKRIEEFVGRANDGSTAISVARMVSPAGWAESGQTPEFDEVTLVLDGALRVETRSEVFTVNAGQAVIAKRGEWIRYSTPDAKGADYVAVCVPAFSHDKVYHDED